MKSRRLEVRTVGLCLALAGLMAVSSGVAQAETGAYWLVNGVKVTTLLPELGGELENSHGVLLGSIGSTPIHILCTGVTLVAGSHLLAEGGLLGKVQFSGCTLNTLNKEGKVVPLPACTPPGGIIASTTGKGLIRLHNGTPIVTIEPNVGTTFATLMVGEECSFGESIVIGGKLAAKDCENAFLTDKVIHLAEEFTPLTELFLNGNKASKVTVDGSVLLKLAGEHKGLTVSGHPA